MFFRENIAIVLAAAALAVGIAQEVHPFNRRVQPMLMFVVAVLLALRWALRRQARKRQSLLEKVPQHPLGIGDTSSEK